MPPIKPVEVTDSPESPALARRLTLPLVVLFGLGVTIGAGIYVLVGATAGRAGMHAPLAFLLAAFVMAPTAASFAELAGRMPVSAGEATYVRAGFGSERLGLIVGLLVVTVGIISAAAISQGSTGYIRALFPGVPWALVLALVVLLTGMVTAWGILESMAVAGVMTLVEIGGLLVIILVGVRYSPDVAARLPELWHGLSGIGALNGMLSAMLLAFFAFIGFEGLANIAEEVKEPERTIPRAIFITLVLSTLLYVAVTWIALVAVPRGELAASRAPLSLVFERVTGASPTAISAISIVATINGIIAQMVMASRVLYGLAEQGLLPSWLARVHPVTRTPILATAVVMGSGLPAGDRLSVGASRRDDLAADAGHLRLRQCRARSTQTFGPSCPRSSFRRPHWRAGNWFLPVHRLAADGIYPSIGRSPMERLDLDRATVVGRVQNFAIADDGIPIVELAADGRWQEARIDPDQSPRRRGALSSELEAHREQLMSYKTILVHLHDNTRRQALLAAGVGLARTFDAHLIGLSVQPPVVVVPGIAGGDVMVIEDHRHAYRQESARLKAAFETATMGQSFAAEWREADAAYDTVAMHVVEHGRCADLIVASQKDPDWPSSEHLEAPDRVVLESGRPVLLIPKSGEVIEPGKRILVAWNGRRELARAVFDALPLLKRAQAVSVVWVNPQDAGEMAGELPAVDICTALARHGVPCEATQNIQPVASVGAALLSAVKTHGADLLVMGSYGHSRMREFVFGGATRYVLENMTVPVLMSH